MIWKVLKNRSNEIRSNEIRIRRELPVFLLTKKASKLQKIDSKVSTKTKTKTFQN